MNKPRDEEKEKKNVTFAMLLNQLLLWGSLAFMIIDLMSFHYYVSISLFVLFYGITISCYIWNPIYSYLGNKVKDNDTMYQKMKENFKAFPIMTLNVECFHYRSHKGRHRREKVVTFGEQMRFTYYSFKDVSGMFMLRKPKLSCFEPKYIKLELHPEITFADSITHADYISRKENFMKRNENRDTYIGFWDERTYNGYRQYNLVKLTNDEDSIFLQKWVYMLFCILTFGLVYHIIFNSMCIEQNFKVRKVISTRYNLMEKEHAEKFKNLKPSLTLFQKNLTFDEKDIGYVNEANKMAPPSAEELENAKQYDKDVMYCSNMVNTAMNCEIAPAVNDNQNKVAVLNVSANENKDCPVECNAKTENILVLKDDNNV